VIEACAPEASGAQIFSEEVRFDSSESLKAWAESEVRKEFISRAGDMMEKGDQYEIRTGIDFWFTPKGVKPPKPWKQFLLTTTAVYPLSLIIPRVLGPLFHIAPPLGNELAAGLLVAAILTALLTFVVMPPFRFFAQLTSDIEAGRNGGPRPVIDESKLWFEQAFADVTLSKESEGKKGTEGKKKIPWSCESGGRSSFLAQAGLWILEKAPTFVRHSMRSLSYGKRRRGTCARSPRSLC
jgi:hypothetical protein